VIIKVIDSHRNGVSGATFHVVRFSDKSCRGENPGTTGENMLAIVFDMPGHVAVLDADKVGQGEVRFFHNSWRGDYFERELREAIERHCHEDYYGEEWDGGYK